MYTTELRLFEDSKEKEKQENLTFTGSVDLAGSKNLLEALEKYRKAYQENHITESVNQSEVSFLLKKGIQTVLLTSDYSDRPPILDMIMTRITSDTAFDYYPALNEPTIKEVLEGAEYPLTGFKNEYAVIYNKKYGGVVEISMEAIKRTQGQHVKQQAMTLKNAHWDWELENITTDLFNNGTSLSIYDGSFYHAAGGHVCMTGVGSTLTNNTNYGALGQISESNLQTALQEIRLWSRRSGTVGFYTPKYLMVAPSEEWVTLRLIQSDYRDAANYGHTKNVLANRMEVIVNPFLTTQSWFILTNVPGLIYSVESDLAFFTEAKNSGADFWRDTYAFKSSKQFGYGIIDWRSSYRGN